MRASVFTCLILVALAGFGLRGSMSAPTPVATAAAVHAQAPVAAAKPAKPVSIKSDPQGPLWQTKVESKPHAQIEEAWRDAVDEAAAQVRLHLITRNPPIEWRPSTEFVRNKLVKQHSDSPVKSELTTMPEMHQLTLQVAISAEDMKLIAHEDHKYRVEQRLWLAGRGLGGLVLLLGALAGYMRLDELTKGYFTFPLRVGALVLGVAGAATVWFVV